jgi:hypothetical protein
MLFIAAICWWFLSNNDFHLVSMETYDEPTSSALCALIIAKLLIEMYEICVTFLETAPHSVK